MIKLHVKWKISTEAVSWQYCFNSLDSSAALFHYESKNDLELYLQENAFRGSKLHKRFSLTGQNRMFTYFWNMAETCSSMVRLYLHLVEMWKFKSAGFCHISRTEMSSHVSVIFKPADFRCCWFPWCFCKRICSCLLHLPKHKREMVLWITMNLNILTS